MRHDLDASPAERVDVSGTELDARRSIQSGGHVTPSFALAEFMGMVTEETGHGAASARVHCTSALLNPHGAVHGAVLFAMVDTAMGAATMTVLDDDHWCVSIDVQLRFCKAVFGGGLVATASVAHAGKRVVHLEAHVRDDDGELIALANGSFAVLLRPRRDASQR